jgi:pimeloyl-ACP methyl ester carboxylesterase
VIDADLVFIHGFWSSAATWDRLVARLHEDESLAGLRVHLFEYESPKLPFLPWWRARIPGYDDIAQSLPSFLEANAQNGAPLIIVTHSQGGLILQRFLAWMLTRGRGRALARISSIVMLSCPNEGSEYLASIRAALGMRRHPQASQLAVLDEDVRHSRQIVLSQVIYATQPDDYHCRIPVYAYSGRTDNIVLRQSAQSVFPNAGVLPGDHFSILDPDARGSLTLDTIRRHIGASLKLPGERGPRGGSPLGGEPGRPHVRQPPIGPDAHPVRERPSLPRDSWNIPPPVRTFIGRDAEIDAITRTLSAQRQPATGTGVRAAALSGTGGVGKTQLSRGFAYCHRDVYRIGWWIPAEDPAAAQGSLLRLATALGVPLAQEPEYRQDPKTGERRLVRPRMEYLAAERISMLWEKLAIRNDWLLIYDNAVSPAEIENLLPGQGDGHVLITSRSPAWHGVAEVLPVGLLAEASAIDLLLRRTNSSDEEDAAVLATELGRLPLALEQAASYVADQGISLADYLDLYRLRQADLLRRGVPLAYEGTVATVITLSLENLSSRQPLAVVIIELCALMAPDEIPISSIIKSRQLLFPGEGEPDLVTRTEAVGALMRCGLLVSDIGNTSRLHRLFQVVLLDQLTPVHFHDRVHAISSIVHQLANPSVHEKVSLLNNSMVHMPTGYRKNELHISSIIRHGRGRVTSTAFADLLELYASAVMIGQNFMTAEPLLLEAVKIRRVAGKDGTGVGLSS